MNQPTLYPSSYAEALALACEVYGALDAGNADGVAACFADDGTWHRLDGTHSGVVAIRAVVDNRPPGQITAHCVSNLRLMSQGDAHTAEYILTVFGSSSKDSPRLVSLIDCFDELVRIEGRGLRIHSKRTKLRFKFPQ